MKYRILDTRFVCDSEKKWKKGDLIELGKGQGKEALELGFVELVEEKKTKKKTVEAKKTQTQREIVEDLIAKGLTLDEYYLEGLNMNKSADRLVLYELMSDLEEDEREAIAHKISKKADGISKAAILKTAQKHQKGDRMSVETTPTTVTSTTSTTFTTKLNNWGLYHKEEEVLIEQIDEDNYIYNIRGKIGLAEVEIHQMGKEDIYQLNMEGMKFIFRKPPFPPIYSTPSYKTCKELVEGITQPTSFEALFERVKTALSVMYDFTNKNEVLLVALTIAESWVAPTLEAVFYLGVDASKGGGKTTLIEIIALLERHGIVADTSGASIPRIKEIYDANFCVDEIDQNKEESRSDLEGMLRKGYRKGQFYIRVNKTSMNPELFNSFGVYAYTYRGEVEDAFKQRTLMIHSQVSNIKELPALNYYKAKLLKSLADDLFLWYVKNIHVFSKKSADLVVEVGEVPWW